MGTARRILSAAMEGFMVGFTFALGWFAAAIVLGAAFA